MARYWDNDLKEWIDYESPEEQQRREDRERREDERQQQQSPPSTPDPFKPVPDRLPGGPGQDRYDPKNPNDFPGPWNYPNPGPIKPPGDNTGGGGGGGGGGNPQNPGDDVLSDWEQKGYIDAQGYVTLPWGGKITVEQAIKEFYKDRKPTANDIPPWIQVKWDTAYGVPLLYTNQLPADLRNLFQQMYDAARTAGWQVNPVTQMQQQSQYRT